MLRATEVARFGGLLLQRVSHVINEEYGFTWSCLSDRTYNNEGKLEKHTRL